MKLGEYLQYDAVGLAECVARGETSAGELLDLALRQSAVAQPRTNAICRLMEDEARSQLKKKQLAGPFAGVPFLIKDCAQDYAGLPTSYGSRSMLGVIAPEHAYVVRRYLDAGLVIFGKTNLPEFALKARIGLATVRPRQQSLECRSHAGRLQRGCCGRGRLGRRADGGRQ